MGYLVGWALKIYFSRERGLCRQKLGYFQGDVRIDTTEHRSWIWSFQGRRQWYFALLFNMSPNDLQAIEWTLVGLAFVFVCLRIYVRILRRQRPMLSDAFVVLAWMAFVPCCACDIRLYRLWLFVPGRTYEMALTNINEDPYKSIEALKVTPSRSFTHPFWR